MARTAQREGSLTKNWNIRIASCFCVSSSGCLEASHTDAQVAVFATWVASDGEAIAGSSREGSPQVDRSLIDPCIRRSLPDVGKPLTIPVGGSTLYVDPRSWAISKSHPEALSEDHRGELGDARKSPGLELMLSEHKNRHPGSDGRNGSSTDRSIRRSLSNRTRVSWKHERSMLVSSTPSSAWVKPGIGSLASFASDYSTPFPIGASLRLEDGTLYVPYFPRGTRASPPPLTHAGGSSEGA